MKRPIFFLFTCLALFCSCQNTEKNSNDYQNDYRFYESESLNPKKDQAYYQPKKDHVIMSQQFGIPFGIMPIPNNWQETQGNKDGIMFRSRDGVKVYQEQFISYFYSNNPQLNAISQRSGNAVAPVKDINRLIKEDITNYAQKQGLRLVSMFPIEAIAEFDRNFNNNLFKSVPENKRYQCVGTEWIDQQGNKSLAIIRYFVTTYSMTEGVHWGYTFNAMVAPENRYESAKRAFINSIAKFQVNPQWVTVHNSHYSQRSNQSAMNHQGRLAVGNSNTTIGNTSASILDSSFDSWKRRNTMNNTGHSNSINNGIWERSTISNPNTGQSYYVDGQYNHYWINQDNKYFGTDNSLYNPNIDPKTNTQNWTEYNNNN